MKRERNGSNSKSPKRPARSERLEIGQNIHDTQQDRIGVIKDFACQYSHPKAQPVYTYLIQWQDGQIQAVMESALDGDFGLELVD